VKQHRSAKVEICVFVSKLPSLTPTPLSCVDSPYRLSDKPALLDVC